MSLQEALGQQPQPASPSNAVTDQKLNENVPKNRQPAHDSYIGPDVDISSDTENDKSDKKKNKTQIDDKISGQVERDLSDIDSDKMWDNLAQSGNANEIQNMLAEYTADPFTMMSSDERQTHTKAMSAIQCDVCTQAVYLMSSSAY